jgi:hypothetical protein
MVQLTQEQIKKNKAIFAKLNAEHKILPDELLAFLGDALFTVPASTGTSLHNACEGGLMDDLITVAKYANKINNMLPPHLQQPALSVHRVSFLSGIGKTFMYIPNPSEYYVKLGKIYDFAPSVVAMRVGERSAYYAMQYMKLTEDEYQALVNFDKPEEDLQEKWFGSTLTSILRQAVEWAIIDEKRRV